MAQENVNEEVFEDFKDFEDDEMNEPPELEEDLMEEEEESQQEASQEDEEELQQEEVVEQVEVSDDLDSSIFHEKNEETIEQVENSEEKVELSPWEELDENDSVVKKYIFYISKDFVPFIDNLSADERSAYINDAIQIKIDLEDEKKQSEKKAKLISHFVVLVLSFCLMAPVVLFCTHKAIMATFDNYKYSQENFEKLYKQRFAKDKAYMRSVHYNKQIKLKNSN